MNTINVTDLMDIEYHYWNLLNVYDPYNFVNNMDSAEFMNGVIWDVLNKCYEILRHKFHSADVPEIVPEDIQIDLSEHDNCKIYVLSIGLQPFTFMFDENNYLLKTPAEY